MDGAKCGTDRSSNCFPNIPDGDQIKGSFLYICPIPTSPSSHSKGVTSISADFKVYSVVKTNENLHLKRTAD